MKGSFLDFANALGERESNNNYRCINTLGYLGRFQFGKPRLYDLGYSIDGWCPKDQPIKKILTKEQFRNDSALQDALFKKHVSLYKNFCLKKYSEFIDKEVNGIIITISGLVAGAHLLGWGNDAKDEKGNYKSPGVKHFLISGIDSKDGYGTKISEYISKFGDYDLS
jgi:hypothetical protein